MSRIVRSRRAERDLRRIGRGEALARLRDTLEGVAVGEANLDVKPLAESRPALKGLNMGWPQRSKVALVERRDL